MISCKIILWDVNVDKVYRKILKINSDISLAINVYYKNKILHFLLREMIRGQRTISTSFQLTSKIRFRVWLSWYWTIIYLWNAWGNMKNFQSFSLCKHLISIRNLYTFMSYCQISVFNNFSWSVTIVQLKSLKICSENVFTYKRSFYLENIFVSTCHSTTHSKSFISI